MGEFLKTIRNVRTSSEQIDFPLFRPEIDDGQTWIGHVENIKEEFDLTDLQVLVRVGRFLSGDVKVWFNNWIPEVRDWTTFKEDFLEAFPANKILGKLLQDAAVCNSFQFNTYSAYVHTKVALWRNLRAKWSNEDLIEIIIYEIKENKVQESVLLQVFQARLYKYFRINYIFKYVF